RYACGDCSPHRRLCAHGGNPGEIFRYTAVGSSAPAASGRTQRGCSSRVAAPVRQRNCRTQRKENHMKGITFEGFHPEDRFATGRRTITEHDILQFVTLVGLTEPLFLDMEYIRKESIFGERIAPGSLTFGMAEGLTVQTGIIHGTGLAFVGIERMKLFGPVK